MILHTVEILAVMSSLIANYLIARKQVAGMWLNIPCSLLFAYLFWATSLYAMLLVPATNLVIWTIGIRNHGKQKKKGE